MVIGWGSMRTESEVERMKGTPKFHVLLPDDCPAPSVDSQVTSTIPSMVTQRDRSMLWLMPPEPPVLQAISSCETPDSSVNHVDRVCHETHFVCPSSAAGNQEPSSGAASVQVGILAVRPSFPFKAREQGVCQAAILIRAQLVSG